MYYCCCRFYMILLWIKDMILVHAGYSKPRAWHISRFCTVRQRARLTPISLCLFSLKSAGTHRTYDLCCSPTTHNQVQHRGPLRPVERALQDLPRPRLHAVQLRYFSRRHGQVQQYISSTYEVGFFSFFFLLLFFFFLFFPAGLVGVW